MTVNPKDPETVALVEQLAALLDPTDAHVFRRRVLDRAPLSQIAGELGLSAKAVAHRWDELAGAMAEAWREATP